MHHDGLSPTLSNDSQTVPAKVRIISSDRGPHLRGRVGAISSRLARFDDDCGGLRGGGRGTDCRFADSRSLRSDRERSRRLRRSETAVIAADLAVSREASSDESCFIWNRNADSTESRGAGFECRGSRSVASAVGEELVCQSGSDSR